MEASCFGGDLEGRMSWSLEEVMKVEKTSQLRASQKELLFELAHEKFSS